MKRQMVFLAIFAAGCAGGGNEPRTEEDRVDDHTIEADVNRALSRVDGVDRLKLKIESIRGKVVLSGRVRDAAAAKAAVEAAAKVHGVQEVVDKTEIESK